jgi:hypothetical protein
MGQQHPQFGGFQFCFENKSILWLGFYDRSFGPKAVEPELSV